MVIGDDDNLVLRPRYLFLFMFFKGNQIEVK